MGKELGQEGRQSDGEKWVNPGARTGDVASESAWRGWWNWLRTDQRGEPRR